MTPRSHANTGALPQQITQQSRECVLTSFSSLPTRHLLHSRVSHLPNRIDVCARTSKARRRLFTRRRLVLSTPTPRKDHAFRLQCQRVAFIIPVCAFCSKVGDGHHRIDHRDYFKVIRGFCLTCFEPF